MSSSIKEGSLYTDNIFFRQLSSLEILLKPFSRELWIKLALLLIFCSIFLSFIVISTEKIKSSRNNSASESLLTVFGIFIQQSISFNLNSHSLSIIMAGLFLFGLVISAAYSGGLASSMNIVQ